MNRYSSRMLVDQINAAIEPTGLLFCTLTNTAGVPELGNHFLLHRETLQIVTPHCDIATFAHALGLLRLPAVIGA